MWFRWLACAAAAAACAAPGVAQAHGGPTFVAGADTGTAPDVEDGVIDPNEWADANTYNVTFGSLGNATVRLVHTPTDLYVAAVVQDSAPGLAPAFGVFFDDDHDGSKDHGEDVWRAQVGSPGSDLFYNAPSASHINDADGDAPNNTTALGTIAEAVGFELRHPLCSDTPLDLCTSVALGQTLGLDFQYEREPGVSASTPGPDLFDPNNNWAHLLLAAGDVVAPTASVTAPAAGSILRGTVDVAATASDNVGVTRVDFRYFDGATDQFVELGSDTDPPYTATFDTTQVANTAVLDATIYAVAHDAAGNTGTFGNGVTVDNAAPSRIVFESDRDGGNSEIYAMSPAGTGLTRLTSSPAVDSRPSLSPNGNFIAWQSAGQIWLMRSDGSEKQQLTTTGTNGAPTFSPDGTKIAFESNRSGNFEIWVMNADGTAPANLSNRPESSEVNPAWSPNGANLAFDSDRQGNRDIFTMNAAGGEQTNLTANSLQLDSDPDWSPDGTRLLFVSARGDFTSVWSMNTGGEDLVDVTEAPIFDADPAWSPDGSHVVFARDAGGQTFNLWTARADGTAKRPLTNATSTQRNSFADWGSRPSETIVTLEPVADTFVRASDPTTPHGSETTFDVHAGASVYCSQGPGPAYGLLRFNLSSLPAGVQVTDARLHLTVAGGFAQDGDPVHYAIRLNSNDWSESVTWNGRPADGIVHVAPQPTINGTPLSSSQDVLGIGNAFNANCNAPTPPAVRTFTAPSNRPQSFANAVGSATGGALSLQIWSLACGTPTTVPCQSGGTQKAYFLRYHSREAADPTLRPKLVVTYAPGVDVNTFTATPPNPMAGLAQVDLDDVPSSVLLAPPRTTASTPLGDTPLGDTPLGDTPLGDTPLGDTPLGDTSLGLDALIAELRTVPLASLPLLREGGWPAVLAGTALADRALQNLSLGDLFAFTPRLAVLDDITLAELDYSRSSLGDVVTVAYALGNSVTLSELSFTNADLDPALRSWCMVTTTDCANTSVLALGLRGAPLGDTPLGDTPLGDTPLGDTPLGDTPLGDTPLGDTPLGDTPLGDTPLGDTDLSRAPLGDTPLGDTPLGDTNLNRAPLGDTPLGDTPISALNCTLLFVTCPPGTQTLSQSLSLVVQGAKLRDLVAALRNPNDFTVAQLLAVLDPPSDYTLAQVAAIFKASSGLTFNDLLAAVLRAGAQWERIDLTQPALARVATGGGSVDLISELSVSGASILTFKVDLPSGWTAVGTPSIETVPPGAATALDVVDVQTIPGGTRHTLRTPNPIGGDLIFHFGARPGTTLGPATASLSVAAGNGTPTSPPADSVNVQETFEPNNDPDEAPTLAPGALYLSYLTGAEDTDYFRVTVPASGTRTTIRLSHLPEDYDLVVYGRQGVTPLVTPGSAAPLETPVLADSGAPITHLTDALPPETLDDLTLLSDRPVLGVSAFRSTEDEAVVALSDGVPGEYIVQVRGYNGATSVEPYMLRIEHEAPRLAPTCPERFPGLSFGAEPAPGVNIASIPTDADTVFLANGPQLAATGGQAALGWFTTTNLNRLRAAGHPSALVRLEDDQTVRNAYRAWNLTPCSTASANAVVSAITEVVRTIRTQRPSVRYLVLLGNDRALPFARLDDLTTIANEGDYASTFARNDDLYGSLFEHRVLSDDPYATTDPIPYLQRQLFVPQLAVGRLVETGAQISGALERFAAFGGVLDPTSARTSGYDFLQDGANGVAAAFASIVGGQQPVFTPPLIGDDWTQSTLAGALGTTTGLFGMNGHADHNRLQPAAGPDLFSATNLPASLERAVVFSMGCHSGLSVSDTVVGRTLETDWPQTYAGKDAAAYAGNLGYGYGDTVTVAYSEALNVRLAQGLRDGLPIGEALVEAKQGYLASQGVVGVYDEKAMSEFALYGLPMWSLGVPPSTGTPQLPAGVERLSTDPDPVTGLQVDRYRSQPALNENQPPIPEGRFWTGPSGVQITHLRPLQPKVEFQVAPDAHGLLITGLASTDQSGVDPVYARPIVDSSGAEPELPFADVAFPAKIQSLITQQTRTGRRVSAVLVHGQFFSDDTVDADGEGHQRLFSRVDLDVLRSNGTDREAPRFDGIEAFVLPDSDIVSFSTDVVDLPSETAADVARVLVGFRDETSPTWRFLDLRRGTGANWGGTAPTTGTRIEYFVQAVDRWGNVAASTNKGILFAGAPPATPSGPGVEPSLSGSQTAGWFTPSAQLNIEAADGVAVSVSIDKGPLTPFTAPVTIATDGLHTIDIRGSNGYEAKLLAPVDTQSPTVTLDNPGATVPLNGKVPLAFRCGDTASGVATCTAKVNGVTRDPGFEVPTAPLNSMHTIEVTATDRVGNPPTSQTFTYKVGSRGILYINGNIGSGDIFTLPADAGLTTVPTRLAATSFPEADPAWSPDSRRIAFSSNRDGTWRVYLMDADGTDVTQLPTGTGNALDPAWSPDGSRIAFVSTRSGNFDIWVVNVNGTGLSQVTTDSKLDLAPSWTPTNQITFANGPLLGLDIWKINPNRTGKTRLTKTQDVAAETSSSPNGTIAFARRKGLRFEIWTMTASGGSQTKAVGTGRWDFQPSWLQDGKLVFASGIDENRDFDLYRATKSGTSWSFARITNAPGNERAPNG